MPSRWSEQGGFAEFAAAPESQCVKLPASLPLTEAAAMALVYDTAWFALRDRARIAPGDTVLVLGATGGVGLAAIQFAKAFGARVLGGVASPDKADIVRAAGADAIIDLAAPDLHESLRAQVYAHTDKRGADVILDMLGGDIFDAAIRALAWRGRLVVIGFAAGRIPDAQGELSAVEEHRSERPAGERLSKTHAAEDAGLLRRNFRAARRRKTKAPADQDSIPSRNLPPPCARSRPQGARPRRADDGEELIRPRYGQVA